MQLAIKKAGIGRRNICRYFFGSSSMGSFEVGKRKENKDKLIVVDTSGYRGTLSVDRIIWNLNHNGRI